MTLSKNWYTIAIIFILLVAIVGGYIYFTGEENRDDENFNSYTEYHYELEIESKEYTTVFWPMPYNPHSEEDNLSKLVNDFEILQGEGNIEVNKTLHGKGLSISFREKIVIEGHRRLYDDEANHNSKWNNYFFEELTMKNKTGDQEDSYLVYSSSDNLKIYNFECYYENVGEYDSDRIVDRYVKDLSLEKGWQTIEFSGYTPNYESP